MPKSATYKSQFERAIAAKLQKAKIKFKYEGLRLEYLVKRHYKPDWVLESGIIIESKGNFRSSDRSKHLLVRELNPDYDIRFLFQADNKLSKKSNTRYSDWCEKHGFLYAIGEIPKEWLKKRK